MKLVKFLFLSLLISFSACKKDESLDLDSVQEESIDPSRIDSNLIGHWFYYKSAGFDDNELTLVMTYDFKKDGSYEHKVKTIQGIKQDISISSGKFITEDPDQKLNQVFVKTFNDSTIKFDKKVKLFKDVDSPQSDFVHVQYFEEDDVQKFWIYFEFDGSLYRHKYKLL